MKLTKLLESEGEWKETGGDFPEFTRKVGGQVQSVYMDAGGYDMHAMAATYASLEDWEEGEEPVSEKGFHSETPGDYEKIEMVNDFLLSGEPQRAWDILMSEGV